MRVLPVVLLLALLAAAPLALGQIPAAPQCGTIETQDPAVPAAIPPGSAVEVTLTVELTGELPATVSVGAVTNQPGWSVTGPPPQRIAANGRADFVFTVTADETATQNAIVTFNASAVCHPPGDLPCPQNACDIDPKNAQVEVPLQPDAGFTLPGLDALGGSPEYLIAGVVLIGLAVAIPLAMRRKKTGLVAACPEPLKMVRAGRGASFPIEIRNPSKEAATAQFEVGGVPEGWSAFMPLPEVQLAARESRSLWLMVRSPTDAKIGDAVEVELRLRDPRRGTNGSAVKVRAEVQGGPEA